MLACASLSYGQVSRPPRVAPIVYADTDLVQDPGWISGTVAKEIVIIGFKSGTTPERRAAIIASINGRVVGVDSLTQSYTLRVARHPDACGVRQALAVLDKTPEVDLAVPDLLFTMDRNGMGGLIPLPTSQHGSGHPCPAGSGLLK